MSCIKDIVQLINILILCKFLSKITFNIRVMPYFVEGTTDSSSRTGFSSFVGRQTVKKYEYTTFDKKYFVKYKIRT